MRVILKLANVKAFGAVVLLLGLGACNPVATTKNVTPTLSPPIQSSKSASWRVRDVRVTVPKTLSVSEANLYLPPSDIVWREDPFGDRHAQVLRILEDAISLGAKEFNGYQSVYVDIELVRFHALSQKARATVGGRHTIKFMLSVRDAASGLELVQPTLVEASLKALGGQQGIDAAMRGETQKVRISRHVAGVIQQQLKTYTK